MIYCLYDEFNSGFYPRPTRRTENHDGNRAFSQVLLVLQIRIGSDQHLEPCNFGDLNEFAIAERRPSSLVRGLNFVLWQELAKWRRCALIEQDLHLCRGQRAAGGMFKHGAYLFKGDARKPLHEL